MNSTSFIALELLVRILAFTVVKDVVTRSPRTRGIPFHRRTIISTIRVRAQFVGNWLYLRNKSDFTNFVMVRFILKTGVCTTLLVCSFLFVESAWADSLVSISRHTFCRKVVNLEAADVVSDPAQLKPGESLHLWLEIQINRAGLKYLRAIGKLPVYVRWGRDGWLTDPPFDIGISSDAWNANENGIILKASQGSGAFTWRTHTNKIASVNGRYYVSILDANKKVITSIDLPAMPTRPEITVIRE